MPEHALILVQELTVENDIITYRHHGVALAGSITSPEISWKLLWPLKWSIAKLDFKRLEVCSIEQSQSICVIQRPQSCLTNFESCKLSKMVKIADYILPVDCI